MLERTVAVSGLLAGTIYEDQIKLESECRDAGVRRYWEKAKEAIERHEGAGLPAVNRLTQKWFPDLVAAVKVEQMATLQGDYGPDRHLVGPIICELKADVIAAIAIREVLSACLHAGGAGIKRWKLMHQLGRSIVAEVNVRKLKKLHGKKLVRLRRGTRQGRDARRINAWAKKNLNDPVVGTRFSTAVGNKVLALVLDIAWLPTTDGGHVPAFAETQSSSKQRTHWVALSHHALACLDALHRERETIHPRREPMLVEPYPWSQDDDGQIKGGYITDRTPYILKSTKRQRELLKKADLTLPNRGRTAVEKNPWRFNKRAWAVAEAMLASDSAPGLPPVNDLPFAPRLSGEQDTPENRQVRRKENAIIHKRNAALYSARSMLYEQAAVVRRFIDEGRFYNPHAFDFRQRLVPIPPYLNHMGGDFCRGLLETGWENPVTGEEGYRHLLIHAANCYGIDKVGIEDRVKWSMSNMSLILDCARDPLATDFWHKADKGRKPWQFLAACFAIQDPEGAGSRLPCQFDGSANVLQHYAAMTLDPHIAAAVNLIPSGYPADPYMRIAEKVLELVQNDTGEVALTSEAYVSRDLTKRPLMIRYYGGTPYGLKRYIGDSLIEAGIDVHPDLLKEMKKYLYLKIKEATGNEYAGADATMEWLQACARLIVGKDRPVGWNTPLGFPVEQPYREVREVAVMTATGQVKAWVVNDEDMPLNKKRHVNAVAPNFVHSIDSTHMLLTAMECSERTIWFAPVHDCFWTHANTAAEMNAILREKFIDMHRRDVVGFTLDQWKVTHKDIDFPAPPPKGDFDLNLVREAVYAFA